MCQRLTRRLIRWMAAGIGLALLILVVVVIGQALGLDFGLRAQETILVLWPSSLMLMAVDEAYTVDRSVIGAVAGCALAVVLNAVPYFAIGLAIETARGAVQMIRRWRRR